MYLQIKIGLPHINAASLARVFLVLINIYIKPLNSEQDTDTFTVFLTLYYIKSL